MRPADGERRRPAVHTVVNENSQVYYSGQYWNDLPRVLEYMCENFTGDKKKWWVQDFKDRFCQTPFEHGLVLNCGNGWVERELIDTGIVRRTTAFDYSKDLLDLAQQKRGDRSIYYLRADANMINFREDSFDVVFNVAALHHVQYMNRLCRMLCGALRESGILVSFDYIGPRRNQYSIRHWYHVVRINRRLPEFIRKDPLKRAHLPTSCTPTQRKRFILN